jgi:hypothetical protein
VVLIDVACVSLALTATSISLFQSILVELDVPLVVTVEALDAVAVLLVLELTLLTQNSDPDRQDLPDHEDNTRWRPAHRSLPLKRRRLLWSGGESTGRDNTSRPLLENVQRNQVAPDGRGCHQNIENNPMQSSQRPLQATVWAGALRAG